MCSAIVRTFFFLCLVLSIGLIVASLLTPFWRNFKASDAFQGKGDASFGLLRHFCGEDATASSPNLATKCAEGFDKKEPWEKTALICLGIALLSCLLALGWSFIYCLGCCCKSCLAPPLPVFTGLSAIALAIGVTVYVVMSNRNPFNKSVFHDWKEWEGTSDFGISMWLAVAAIALLIVDTISGIILVRLHDGPSPTPV